MKFDTVCAALGDPVRAAIVALLVANGPMSVSRLAEEFPITRQAVGKHVRILREAAVIAVDEAGRERIARVETATLQEVSARLDELAAEWDRRLKRLRMAVEAATEGD